LVLMPLSTNLWLPATLYIPSRNMFLLDF